MVGTILILAKFIVTCYIIRLISRWKLLAPDLVHLNQNYYQINLEIGTIQTVLIFILKHLVISDSLWPGSLRPERVSGCLR